jgi:hypothetical protein
MKADVMVFVRDFDKLSSFTCFSSKFSNEFGEGF